MPRVSDRVTQQVRATLRRARRPLSSTEIADHLGLDGPIPKTVKKVCDGLVAAGEARREPGRPARYAVAWEGR